MILIDVLTDVISGKNCYIILVNYITISKGTRQKKSGKFHIGSDPPPPMTENGENFQKKKNKKKFKKP